MNEAFSFYTTRWVQQAVTRAILLENIYSDNREGLMPRLAGLGAGVLDSGETGDNV